MQPVDGVPDDRSSSSGCLDALMALDQGEADATPAAEAVYWLTHPEIAAATVNTLTALLDKWESEPEWTGPPEEPEEDECEE
jgi:hypothetical protein